MKKKKAITILKRAVMSGKLSNGCYRSRARRLGSWSSLVIVNQSFSITGLKCLKIDMAVTGLLYFRVVLI